MQNRYQFDASNWWRVADGCGLRQITSLPTRTWNFRIGTRSCIPDSLTPDTCRAGGKGSRDRLADSGNGTAPAFTAKLHNALPATVGVWIQENSHYFRTLCKSREKPSAAGDIWAGGRGPCLPPMSVSETAAKPEAIPPLIGLPTAGREAEPLHRGARCPAECPFARIRRTALIIDTAFIQVPFSILSLY
jgi:hypothetical protein